MHVQGFPYWGDGGSPPPAENFLPPTGKIPPPKVNSPPPPIYNNFHVITQYNLHFSCCHCSCTIFVLISYSLYTLVMLILILIDVQYSQKAVSSFENGWNGQNHS